MVCRFLIITSREEEEEGEEVVVVLWIKGPGKAQQSKNQMLLVPVLHAEPAGSRLCGVLLPAGLTLVLCCRFWY